jgi:hypothetical protein
MGRNDDDLISPTDPEASAFANAARAYCDFIDAAIVQRPDPFYGPLQGLLIRLVELVEPLNCYAPDIKKRLQKKYGALADEFPGKHPEIGALVSADSRQLQEWASEWEEHDSAGNDRRFMLWDDLGDVYRELRQGLVLWDLQTAPACSEAAYVWRWSYEHHWGDHLFRAAQTIHEMRFGIYRD